MLADWVEQVIPPLETAANAFEELRISYEQQSKSFTLRPPAEHALLDLGALEELVDRAAPECIREVREQAARAIETNADAPRLKAAVHAKVARHAKSFSRYTNLDEALLAAGARGRIVMENAVKAAEPAVRTEADWDRRRHCILHAYISATEDHPLAVIARGLGRSVYPAPAGADAGQITIVTVDYAIELPALKVTRDALEAHVQSRNTIPVFADQRFTPMADVTVPGARDWFAYLAIPMHEHLNTGVITVEGRGYFYKGEILGKTHVTASTALLEKSARLAFLPPHEALCQQTEETLWQAGGQDIQRVVELLNEIEAKLDRHIDLARPAEKQVLMYERAAARAVRAGYEEQIGLQAAHTMVWGNPHLRPGTGPAAPRNLAREPSDDGSPAHRIA